MLLSFLAFELTYNNLNGNKENVCMEEKQFRSSTECLWGKKDETNRKESDGKKIFCQNSYKFG